VQTRAIVFEQPRQLAVRELALATPSDADVVVDIAWSSISAGTERLLWEGRMPMFPGMGYPLVPGYESVGRVISAGDAVSAASQNGTSQQAPLAVGSTVFVPGANCYGPDVRGLFGGASRRVVVPASRVIAIDPSLNEQATLLALAATALHALRGGAVLPDLVIGHGVFGRLTARLIHALGGSCTVWERNEARMSGATNYNVITADADARRDYACIFDASGDASLLDKLVMRLAKNGEIVLAGFYSTPIQFAFPPAFMKEARLRIAAEWSPKDLADCVALHTSGSLSLDGLITDISPAERADEAYRAAFDDPRCLKMVLDWSTLS
jgi:3-hydroxyethyl bacteriochlorophyllide a dehydrogenase